MPNTPIGPIEYSQAITPHDSADIAECRALLTGGAGDVKVTFANGKVDTLPLAQGVWHPMRIRRIWATGTTATGIHAGY